MDKTWIEKKKNNNIKNMWQGLLPFRILVNSVCVWVFVDTRCTWLRRGWWRRWWCWRCWGDGWCTQFGGTLKLCHTDTISVISFGNKEEEDEEVCKCVFCLRRKSVYSSAKTREFLKVTGTDSQQTVVYRAMSSRRLDEWLEMYIGRICWDGMALQGFLPGWVLRMFGQQQGATSLFVRLDSFLFLVIFVDSHTYFHTLIHSQIRYTCVCVCITN